MRKLPISALVFMIMALPIFPEPEIKIHLGHHDSVGSVAFSPDGKYALSGSGDRTVKIWDIASGKELKSLTGHEKYVTNVAFSRDGKTALFCAFSDKNIRVWDIASGTLQATIAESADWVYAAAFSPDGKYVLSSSSGYFPKLWNLETGKIVREYTGYNKAIKTLRFSANGKYILLGSAANELVFCETETGKVMNVIRYPSDDKFDRSIVALDISPDNKLALSAADHHKVKLWDLASGKELRTIDFALKDEGVAAFSPDGKYILAGCGWTGEGRLSLFETNTGKLVRSFTGHSDIINSACFSPDGNYILSGARDQTVRLWDKETGNLIKTFSKYSARVNSVAFSPDGKYLVSGHGDSAKAGIDTHSDVDDCTVKIWDAATGTLLKTDSGHTSIVLNAQFSPDGKRILSGADSPPIVTGATALKLWDARGGGQVMDYGEGYSVLSSRFLPDGNSFLAVTYYDPVKLRDSGFGKVLQELENSKKTSEHCAIDVSKDGKYAILAREDKTIGVWNIASGKELLALKGHSGNTSSIKFSPDGKYVLSGSLDSTLKLWDAFNGREIHSFAGHSGPVIFASFLSDGKEAMSVSEDQTIRLWDVSTGKALSTAAIRFDAGSSTSVSLSPDEKFIAMSSVDGTIKKWDLRTGGLVYSSISTPDGEYLTWTPEGFFTGSEKLARKAVYIVDGMNAIDIDQFYDLFYRPDLVSAKIRGEDISRYAKEVSVGKLLKGGLPPVVEFATESGNTDARDVTLKMRVIDIGGGIGKVTVFLDGAPITLSEGGRGIVVAGKPINGGKAVAEYDFTSLITLRQGINAIELSAYNKNNTIESRKASIELVYKSAVVAKPNLHILAVAVDKYRDKSLWLNYSIADADAILAGFKSNSKSLFQSISSYRLYDADVTRKGFEAIFDEMSPRISPDDVFVLYVAGHGVTYSGDGDYYFLPADFRYTDSADIPKYGISKGIITACLAKVKAQKSLLLFDTCNSGSFIDGPGTRGISEKTAVDRLKKSIGRAIIVASSDSQPALEGFGGHGVFTYAFLEGLGGVADSTGKGVVTITSLASFLESEVPEITYKKWGYEQVPQKELPKEDFPIGMK